MNSFLHLSLRVNQHTNLLTSLTSSSQVEAHCPRQLWRLTASMHATRIVNSTQALTFLLHSCVCFSFFSLLITPFPFQRKTQTHTHTHTTSFISHSITHSGMVHSPSVLIGPLRLSSSLGPPLPHPQTSVFVLHLHTFSCHQWFSFLAHYPLPLVSHRQRNGCVSC